MTLVLVVAVLALIGIAARGGLGRLATLRVRGVRLLVAAAGLQLGASALAPGTGWVRVPATVLAVLLVALFLAGNSALPGVPLVAAGLLLNVAVVTANGAMPVSVVAAERAGVTPGELRLDDDPLREPLDGHTRLGLLGDRVPVALPWRPQVVSVGDVLVASGVLLLLVVGSSRGRGPQGPSLVERSMVLARESTTRGSYS